MLGVHAPNPFSRAFEDSCPERDDEDENLLSGKA